MKNPYVKWTLIILAILAVIVIIYFLIKALKPQPIYPPGGNPPPAGGGIWDALGNIDWGNLFGGNKKCDPANPGFQKDGVYNPDKCGILGGGCDPNRPGWNLAGFPDTACDFG